MFAQFPLPGGEGAWVKGLSAAQPGPANPQALALVAKLVTEAVRSVMRDPSKKVVAAACELMQHVCELWGPQAVVPQHRHILGTVLRLLREKAPCQDTEYDYGEEDEAELVFMDHDNILVDAVADLIGVLARTCGASFGPLFMPLAGEIILFTRTPLCANLADNLTFTDPLIFEN